jgi:DASH complex subunit DAM1
LFQELSDSFIDLSSNLESSSLVCKSLNEFNEGFASYLYGLRINSYTLDFKHSPSHYNFELQNQRRKQQQRETVLIDEQVDDDGETTFTLNGGGIGGGVGDSTFITNDEQSFIIPRPTSSSSSSIKRGGGGSSNIARGRGTGRPGLLTKRKKEEISAFADPIFPLLPINLRENRRNECEKVLWALKQHSQGIGLNDLTKHLAGQSPPIPQVRINEVLLALVRAKVATKGLVKVSFLSFFLSP